MKRHEIDRAKNNELQNQEVEALYSEIQRNIKRLNELNFEKRNINKADDLASFAQKSVTASAVSTLSYAILSLVFFAKISLDSKTHIFGIDVSIFDNMPEFHISVWLIISTFLYISICFIFSFRDRKKVFEIFLIPSWIALRNFGEQRVARISYFLIAIIPLGIYIIVENPFGLDQFTGISLPINVKISFFVSFFLRLP
jgi:hypothetical protein